ncbi:hypothetical protein Tco_1224808, partial [Tanacetum coccineum]
VLDHLVIQKLNAEGRLEKKEAKKEVGLTRLFTLMFQNELTAILSFGAEELFKEERNDEKNKKRLLSMDIDESLARSEGRSCPDASTTAYRPCVGSINVQHAMDLNNSNAKPMRRCNTFASPLWLGIATAEVVVAVEMDGDGYQLGGWLPPSNHEATTNNLKIRPAVVREKDHVCGIACWTLPGPETVDPNTIDKYYKYVNLNYLDTLERLGYAMPNKLGVSLILNSLNKAYDQFIHNYNMHNMGKTIAELHAMLKLHEKGIPKKAETLAVLAIR